MRSMHSTLRGCGSPWPITLVSRATTGRPPPRLPGPRRPLGAAGSRPTSSLTHDGTAGHTDALAATLAPARHAGCSAVPGSIPRASDASKTPSKASPAPVGSRSSIASGTASYSQPVQHQHGPVGSSLHARGPIALAEQRVRRRPGPPRSATSASRSFARTTVAPAASSSNPSGPTASTRGHDAASTADPLRA